MRIRLKSVRNIRDFSEYGWSGFIRSAHLSALTREDADALVNRYRLKTIVDLRTSQEVEEKPDAAIPGVEYIHIPIFEGAVPGISHEQETDEVMRVIPDMPELYRLLVTEDAHVQQLQKAMAVIFDPSRDGAVLWHCSEGKDRCGIVSALFLLSRGAQPEAVIQDYLRTNRANWRKAWKYYVLILLSQRGRAAAAKVRDAFLAKREYMQPIMARLVELAQNTNRGNASSGDQPNE